MSKALSCGDLMKVEITEKVENPLLRRTEVKFKVDHEGGPTPKRLDVRAQLASQLGVSEELVVIDKLASMYGQQVASGMARAYSSRERLEELEPKYLLKRGLPAEAKEEAKPEEKPKAEKPKEKPKEEKPKEKPAEKPAEEKKPEKPEEKAKPGKVEEVKKPEQEEEGGEGGQSQGGES